MKHLMIILLPCLFLAVLNAQEKAFFVGHSLSDAIPEMVESFAADRGESLEYGYAQIIGSPLHYQWSCLRTPGNWPGNFPDGGIFAFYDPGNGLPTGEYQHLILNEGVPRIDNAWGIEETKRFVDSFYTYAVQFNPDIHLYLSELWHCLKSGTPTECHYDEDSNPWRQRLDDDLPMWEKAVDYINDKYDPDPPMKLIPSGQALAMLYDSIEEGAINGVSRIEDVFHDDIHGNDTVRYLVACVNYFSITKESPVGLTNAPKNWWGGDFGFIPRDLALQLQNIAHQAVCDYPHNNIFCQTTAVDYFDHSELIIYPNPTNGELYINCPFDDVSIFDMNGKRIVVDDWISQGDGIKLVLKPGAYSILQNSTNTSRQIVVLD